jgi:hypothetical protein
LQTLPESNVTPLRVPPSAVEAEQSVLGGILLSPDSLAAVTELLAERHFFRRDHRIIFRAMCALADDEKPADPVTLGQWIESNGLSEEMGGTGYLVELASNTPSAANIRAYAEIVREKSALRELIDAGTEIVNGAFSPEGQTATEIYHRSLAAIAAVEPSLAETPPPTDLFGEHDPPTLRREWLPPPIQDVVFSASDVKGSPPEVMALSMLIACAAACDDKFQVQPRANEPGWKESARLWGVIVGDPSSKKTPAMKLAMSSLAETNQVMLGKYVQARAEYERQVKLHNLSEKKSLKAQANGEGMVETANAPVPPKNIRLITNDGTTEGITKLLADNERGLLYYTDELTSWLGGMGRYSANGGAADRAFWLECYQGGSKVIDRASAPPVNVPNLSVNVIGSIQPDRIRSLASRMDDDGLLQRCMVAVIPTAERRPSDNPEPTAQIQAYDAMLKHIYATRADGYCIVQMSPEADAVRREMDNWRIAIVASDGLPGMLRSAVAKYEGLFPRLCLTYHVMSCASLGKYPVAVPITGATARRVASFMRLFLFPNAVSFYTSVMGLASPGFTLARKVADYLISSNPRRVTRRNIIHGCNAWRDAPEWCQAQAVATLEQAGWLIPDASGGRFTKAWILNPQVASMYETRAAGIRQRRAAMAKILADMRQDRAAESSPGQPHDSGA